MAKVLISDKLSPTAVKIFKDNNIEVDYLPEIGKDKEKLAEIIGDYDGLAIRSATKVTEKMLKGADNLKVVGRAGIGVDNVDIGAATAKGIIVMNTPFGNSITTAEHAITLMLALARQIPAADASTRASKWEKSRFMGVEVTNKIFGLIGCGNIGSIVAERAQGLKMKVIAYDPFLTPERALALGVEKVELDDLLARADFISLHTPLIEATRNIIDAAAFDKMKPGMRIINCARGGLIDEAALKVALESGRVKGAALDVYLSEPAKDNPLFEMENVICTPHLGASTSEAQENVAIQVAEQICAYLNAGEITNALNFPSISAEEAPHLTPFVRLAEVLGSFAGQVTETGLSGIRIEYEGEVAALNTKPMSAAALTGLLTPLLGDVNMVSAPVLANQRGIQVETITREQQGAYENYIRVTVISERQERSIAGTIFGNGDPRLIQVKGINMEAELSPNMLYITNADKPGFIGRLGTLLGDLKINIANFNLGRVKEGADAIALLNVDSQLSNEQLDQIRELEGVVQVKALRF
ncbi:D-3-phosphoglycerate dehydrogenase [hydrothermal vent metagenome]|uniref:D-3-phosphoglycerate dehydrogenase n=1 Tax=hydrothermal vent metagenome TaxID=652676 RepID=A0A3B0U8U4_9ZZZZ